MKLQFNIMAINFCKDNHSLVLSSFMTYNKFNTMDATYGAGTVYPFEATGVRHRLQWSSIFYFSLNVLYFRPLFVRPLHCLSFQLTGSDYTNVARLIPSLQKRL